jgi:hypothetical protein
MAVAVFLVAFLVVLGTSIWAGLDWSSIEKRLPARKIPGASKTTQPMLWFIMCLMIWIIFFPYYLLGPRRKALSYIRIDEEKKSRGSAGGFHRFERETMGEPGLATRIRPIMDRTPKAGQTAAAPSVVEQLAQLAGLHDAGNLSDEEFTTAKAGLLKPYKRPRSPARPG